MATPTTTVEIAFDLSAISPDFFTLDDPVKGVLDNVTYLLAGPTLTDVTDYVRRVSITRGRSRELDRFATGGASIVLDNRARTFDPTEPTSPYTGQILPRKQVQITTNGETVFSGYTQDWEFSYDISGDSTVTTSAMDGFAILARQDVSGVVVSSENSGDRIDTILSSASVAWPTAQRSISAGSATLAAGTVADSTNALAYLQSVETVEAGQFFITADGLAAFRPRGLALAQLPPAYTTDLIFTDESTLNDVNVRYKALSLEQGTDLLYNDITVASGTAWSVNTSDATSQVTYGIIPLAVDGELLNSAAEGTALATYLIDRYADAWTRVSEVTVELNGMPTTVLTKVLQLDLADVVPVKFQPNGIGDRITRVSTIEGITHDIGIDSHQITFRFAATPGY
jgi:hypothetical protein